MSLGRAYVAGEPGFDALQHLAAGESLSRKCLDLRQLDSPQQVTDQDRVELRDCARRYEASCAAAYDAVEARGEAENYNPYYLDLLNQPLHGLIEALVAASGDGILVRGLCDRIRGVVCALRDPLVAADFAAFVE